MEDRPRSGTAPCWSSLRFPWGASSRSPGAREDRVGRPIISSATPNGMQVGSSAQSRAPHWLVRRTVDDRPDYLYDGARNETEDETPHGLRESDWRCNLYERNLRVEIPRSRNLLDGSSWKGLRFGGSYREPNSGAANPEFSLRTPVTWAPPHSGEPGFVGPHQEIGPPAGTKAPTWIGKELSPDSGKV
jgi:hypothetical protein